MKLSIGAFLTRDGRIAVIEEITEDSDTAWPFVGYIGDEDVTWTDFGGASHLYSRGEKEIPDYNQIIDIVRAVSIEDNPEYFL